MKKNKGNIIGKSLFLGDSMYDYQAATLEQMDFIFIRQWTEVENWGKVFVNNSFKDIISIIKERANNYDLWLVAGGELGRLYTGYIKQLGGRAFDIGFVIEYWLELDIPVRLRPFVKQNPFKRLELLLKSKGYKFNRYI